MSDSDSKPDIDRYFESAAFKLISDDRSKLVVRIGMLTDLEGVDQSINRLKALKQSRENIFIVYEPLIGMSDSELWIDETHLEKINSISEMADILICTLSDLPMLSGLHKSVSLQCHSDQLCAVGAKAIYINHAGSQDNNSGYFFEKNLGFYFTGKRETASTQLSGRFSTAVSRYIVAGKSSRDALVLAWAENERERRNGSLNCFEFLDFPQISQYENAINCTPFASCDTCQLGLYPVVDSLLWLQRMLQLGVKTLQLRVKEIAEDELEELIQKAVILGKQYNARLFINDYWLLAIKYNAYGIHLGQEDLQVADLNAIKDAGLRLGLSTHSEFEWSYASTFNPSYLALGAIFHTETKEVVEVGLPNLHAWVNVLKHEFPLVAIGGISLERAVSVLDSGVGSIAVVSAITQAKDYKQATINFFKIIN